MASKDPAPAEPSEPAEVPAGPELVSLVGFEVGRPAPSDVFRALDRDGQLDGPAVATHPGGGAIQIVVAGATVTDGVIRAITPPASVNEA